MNTVNRTSLTKNGLIAVITFLLGVSISTLWFRHWSASVKVDEPDRIAQCRAAMDTLWPNATSTAYFDADTFSADKYMGGVTLVTFTGILRAFGERSLRYTGDGVDEVYRFTWVRTFGNPVSVRTWRCGDIHFVSAGTLNYMKPEILKLPRRLSPAEWSQLSDVLERSAFWKTPTIADTLPESEDSQWLVEGSSHGHFHVVSRWSDGEQAFQAIGKRMLTMSGLDIVQSQIDDPPHN